MSDSNTFSSAFGFGIVCITFPLYSISRVTTFPFAMYVPIIRFPVGLSYFAVTFGIASGSAGSPGGTLPMYSNDSFPYMLS